MNFRNGTEKIAETSRLPGDGKLLKLEITPFSKKLKYFPK